MDWTDHRRTSLLIRCLLVAKLNLRIIGREDFIAMKCFAGGPQDILDARSAYRSAQGRVDLDLVRAVARRFGRDAADNLEQVLAN